MSSLSRVTCKVPGSTSNLGSGFDTLGLALSIYNEITIERADAAGEESRGLDIYPESEMAQETVARFFEESGLEPSSIRVRVRGDVPRARGLGSSVTIRGGILAGLNELFAQEWSKERLVEIVTDLEGHPDNASASILGGFTVSRFIDNPAVVESVAQFDVGEELRFVVVSPEFEVITSASRGVLPKVLDFQKAVASVNCASCVVAALSSGQYDALRNAVLDYMHEPYRLINIPGAKAAIAAGVGAGAYTGWLSGSGSSVLCVATPDKVEAVVAAMRAAFDEAGLASVAYDLSSENSGLEIVSRA